MSEDDGGSERRKDVLAWVTTIAAVLLTAAAFLAGLSITLRAVSLLVLFLVLFGVAIGTRREDSLAYPAMIAYLAFVVYGMIAFSPNLVVAPLLVLAAVVGLGVLIYVLHERLLTPTPWAATYGAPAVVVVAVAMAILDVQTGGVAYELGLDDEVTIESEGSTTVEVGTAVAETGGPFREPVSFPDAHACIYTEGPDDGDGSSDGTSNQSVRRTTDSLDFGTEGPSLQRSAPGSGTLSVPATVLVPGFVASSIDGPVPIERADACPDDAEPPRIVIVPGEGW